MYKGTLIDESDGDGGASGSARIRDAEQEAELEHWYAAQHRNRAARTAILLGVA